jgi:hypothetical protein
LAGGTETGDELPDVEPAQAHLAGDVRSSSSLEVENLALRHKLNVLRRTSLERPVFINFEGLIFICKCSRMRGAIR